MNKQIVVWDLFGGGQNSVYQTLRENSLFDVWTFDITEPTREQHIKQDLTVDNIIEVLAKYPRPQIIVASPLCQSFSQVLQMKGGGTCFWKKENDRLVERPVAEFEALKSGFTKYLKADKQLEIKRLGEKCINNTLAVIEHFKPQFWYIENPANSLMWYYIEHNKADWVAANGPVYKNKTYYNNYGFIIQKATIFLSNIDLHLKHEKINYSYEKEVINDVVYYKVDGVKQSRAGLLKTLNKQFANNAKTTKDNKEADSRSAIPHALIKDIFKNFINKIQRHKTIEYN